MSPATVSQDRPSVAVFAAVILVAAVPVQASAAEDAKPASEEMIAYAVASGERTWQKAQGPTPNLSSRELFTYALALAEARQHPDRLGALFALAARSDAYRDVISRKRAARIPEPLSALVVGRGIATPTSTAAKGCFTSPLPWRERAG